MGSLIPGNGKQTIDDLYKKCVTYIERFNSFTEGHRHEFVLKLTVKLRQVGLSESATSSLLLRDYNFNDSEVNSLIKSVYSYNMIYEAPKMPYKANSVMPLQGSKSAASTAQAM